MRQRPRTRFRYARERSLALLLGIMLIVGLLWENGGGDPRDLTSPSSVRVAGAHLLGRLPAPAEPSLVDSLLGALRPTPSYRLMTIRHIPPIVKGTPLPHPVVGDCKNCHLFVGGPGPGAQFKTPVGAVLEELSKVTKVGPPLLPNSQMPHPPAGRCIKCHDIVVKVPIGKPDGFLWSL